MMITLPSLEEAWVPPGFVKLRDSVRRICAVQLNEALPLKPKVVEQSAYEHAAATVWEEVDEGRLVLLVLSAKGNVALPAGVTRRLPLLRDPRVLSLAYVRLGNRTFPELLDVLGKTFPTLPVGFEASTLEKLERRLRNEIARKAGKARPGRPGTPGLHAAIKKMVETARWTLSQPLKLLTALVNDELSRKKGNLISGKTVSTALEALALETADPRFHRSSR